MEPVHSHQEPTLQLQILELANNFHNVQMQTQIKLLVTLDRMLATSIQLPQMELQRHPAHHIPAPLKP